MALYRHYVWTYENPPHVVVAGTRRSWSAEEKRAILAEAEDPTTTVSAVARRHGLHTSLLFRWRRDAPGRSIGADGGVPPDLRPARASGAATLLSGPSRPAGAIEIEVAGGHRIRVEAGADLRSCRA